MTRQDKEDLIVDGFICLIGAISVICTDYLWRHWL